jgi:hypothetical protein
MDVSTSLARLIVFVRIVVPRERLDILFRASRNLATLTHLPAMPPIGAGLAIQLSLSPVGCPLRQRRRLLLSFDHGGLLI